MMLRAMINYSFALYFPHLCDWTSSALKNGGCFLAHTFVRGKPGLATNYACACVPAAIAVVPSTEAGSEQGLGVVAAVAVVASCVLVVMGGLVLLLLGIVVLLLHQRRRQRHGGQASLEQGTPAPVSLLEICEDV